MRMIDADKLKEKAFGGRKGLINTRDIDDAPTVEAIPVEWLEKRLSMERRPTVRNWLIKLMRDWREEQKNDHDN